jgi:class 3 adenylate cyclase
MQRSMTTPSKSDAIAAAEAASKQPGAAPPSRRPRGLSLRVKWAIAVMLVTLVPLGVLGYATVGIQKDGLEVAEKAAELAVIDACAQIVDATFASAGESTFAVGQLLTEGKITDQELRLTLARQTLGRAQSLLSVGIYQAGGKFIDGITRERPPGSPPAPTVTPLAEIPAALVAEKEPTPRWLPAEHGPQGPVLRFVTAVVRDGKRRAWVVATLDASRLDLLVGELSAAHFGRAGRVLLLDEQLRVLAGHDQVFKSGTAMKGKDIFANVPVAPGKLRDDFGFSTEFNESSGTPMVGSFRSLRAWGLGVAVRRPAAEAFAALARSRQAFSLAGGLVAILALTAGVLLAARITLPVRRLVELTRAYAARQFDRRSPVTTGDELQELGDSMSDMADAISRSEQELERRAVVQSNLSRFLPAEVATAVAAGDHSIALGGEKRRVSVLFADVVAFTSFSESAPPEKVVALLNELFTTLSDVLFKHGGTVDKFIGDCVMAIFGAPTGQDDHAQRALAAADDIHRFVEASSPEWEERYGVAVKVAIGVNSGDAVVGNLGSELRMEYTAIGDVVNVAARLEAIARPGQTLLTRETAQAAGDDFSYAPMGEHPLRGKQKPVEILELT